MTPLCAPYIVWPEGGDDSGDESAPGYTSDLVVKADGPFLCFGDLKGKKPADLKKVAANLVVGKDAVMTVCLGSSDGFLGRSMVLDQNAPYGMNFR